MTLSEDEIVTPGLTPRQGVRGVRAYPRSDRRRAGEVRRRGLLRYRAPRNAPLALGLPRLHIP